MASSEKRVFKDTYSEMASKQKRAFDEFYSKMTSSERKVFNEAYRSAMSNRSNILDRPVPEINVPTLNPSRYVPARVTLTTLKNKINNEISDFVGSIPSFKEQKKNEIVSDQVKS